MVRSVVVILLSIVCGSAAAIGVYQIVARRAQQTAEVEQVSTTPVLVAVSSISRGEPVTAASVETVDWPEELVPTGATSDPDEAVGRVALVSFVAGEPLFADKLAAPGEGGFVASLIEKGMRAYTIQATSPSTSVAGFVRPGDYVDVLLTLDSNSSDESGGGSAITLLNRVKVMAIDQTLDAEADVLEMLTRGEVRSVTLLVTPKQASMLSVGQESGELSLTLRGSDDEQVQDESETSYATIREIQELRQEAEIVRTTPVLVAAELVVRGQTLTEQMLATVDWPEDLVPPGTFSQPGEVVGRTALAGISAREPLFENKLADQGRQGFAASLIQAGMRAYTIQTSGPTSSVAGLVRPGDHVDVLLTLHENASDDLSGGSTATLLQSAEVLAVDQAFETAAESGSTGDSVRGNTSVTLLVTPYEASLLSLGRHQGELSLSLRGGDDATTAEVEPATMEQVLGRFKQSAVLAGREPSPPSAAPDWNLQDLAEAVKGVLQPGSALPPAPAQFTTDEPPPSYIQTHRGGAVGRVLVYRRN